MGTRFGGRGKGGLEVGGPTGGLMGEPSFCRGHMSRRNICEGLELS